MELERASERASKSPWLCSQASSAVSQTQSLPSLNDTYVMAMFVSSEIRRIRSFVGKHPPFTALSRRSSQSRFSD